MKLKRLLAFLFALGGTFFLAEFILRFFGHSLLGIEFTSPYSLSLFSSHGWSGDVLRQSILLYIAAFFIYFELQLPREKQHADIFIFLNIIFIGANIFFGTELIRLKPFGFNPRSYPLVTSAILLWLIITTLVWILKLQKNKRSISTINPT